MAGKFGGGGGKFGGINVSGITSQVSSFIGQSVSNLKSEIREVEKKVDSVAHPTIEQSMAKKGYVRTNRENNGRIEFYNAKTNKYTYRPFSRNAYKDVTTVERLYSDLMHTLKQDNLAKKITIGEKASDYPLPKLMFGWDYDKPHWVDDYFSNFLDSLYDGLSEIIYSQSFQNKEDQIASSLSQYNEAAEFEQYLSDMEGLE